MLGLTSLRLGGHYLAMVTISFQTILTLVLTNWVAFTRGPDGVPNIKRPALLAESGPYLGLCIAALFAVAWFVWRLNKTRLGRAMQAVRDNESRRQRRRRRPLRHQGRGVHALGLARRIGRHPVCGRFRLYKPGPVQLRRIGGVPHHGAARQPPRRPEPCWAPGLLILLPEWLRFLKVIYLAVYVAAVSVIMVFMPDGVWGYAIDAVAQAVARGPSIRRLHRAAWALGRDRPGRDGSVILDVHGLSKHFGGLKAVDDIDLTIRRNTVHALIGPNGSGKTTLLNALNGIVRLTRGAVTLDGVDVTRLPPHRRARHGLGRTFQNIRLFGAMGVLDNVMVGAERPHNQAPAGEPKRHALAALDFVGIAGRAGARVGSLSYGHQRLVEIARALAGSAKLLFLAEPGAGLNHVGKRELVRLLERLKGHGLTIFIIDHDMAMVEQVADHITVLNFGKRIADGTPSDVLRHPDVIAAYLGEERSALSRSHGAP